jgi:hypothetical protein
MEARTPAQILEYTSDSALTKALRGKLGQLILSFFTGVFIRSGSTPPPLYISFLCRITPLYTH